MPPAKSSWCRAPGGPVQPLPQRWTAPGNCRTALRAVRGGAAGWPNRPAPPSGSCAAGRCRRRYDPAAAPVRRTAGADLPAAHPAHGPVPVWLPVHSGSDRCKAAPAQDNRPDKAGADLRIRRKAQPGAGRPQRAEQILPQAGQQHPLTAQLCQRDALLIPERVPPGHQQAGRSARRVVRASTGAAQPDR